MSNYNNIEYRLVESRQELSTFIRLPWKLHKNDKYWLPPLFIDEKSFFNPRKNKALQYCDTRMILAYKDGIEAGRIMGIINRKYNEETGTKFARFAYLDCIKDEKIAGGLLNQLENWARTLKMERVIGPMGLTYLDPMGFQVDGFEHIPAISTYTNFRYMPELVKQAGYVTDEKLAVYKIDLSKPIPELYNRIHQRLSRKKDYSLLEFQSKKDLKRVIIPVMTLMNECFTEIYGYSQLDRHEMIVLAKKYITVLDPELVIVAIVGGEMAGFIIAMPNLSKGIRAARGFLLPFGFIKILKASKKANQLDLLIGGIKKKYQGIGIDVLMGYQMLKIAMSRGYKILDSHLELERNTKMTAEMKKLGGEIYKRYTIFRKDLN